MHKSEQTNGLLIIDKPAGLTSHDVVARLRKILKTKKIGHTGTLDPFATGVLVMLIGKATRLARFLDKDEKRYRALMRFGYETDTGDVQGKSKKKKGKRVDKEGAGFEGKKTGDKLLSDVADGSAGRDLLAFIQGLKNLPPRKELIERVETAIPDFCGEIEQVPPMYSAKKVKGKKLYKMAREGIEIERNPVRVSISELSIASDSGNRADNELILNVTASAGTYIRTLAEDIGRKIKVGCHLAELRRTRAGRFEIKEALSLEHVENLAAEGRVGQSIIPMNEAVRHLPEHRLSDDELKRVAAGMRIDSGEKQAEMQYIRLANEENELVAIGEFCPDGSIQPKIVLASG